MKRTIFALLTCLLFLASLSTAYASGVPGNDVGVQIPVDYNQSGDPAIEAIQSVSTAVGEINATLVGLGKGDPNAKSGCVQVNIFLPDTIVSVMPHPAVAIGMFELINCGASGMVTFSFQATISLPGILDTVITFPEISIPMAAGDTITASNPHDGSSGFRHIYTLRHCLQRWLHSHRLRHDDRGKRPIYRLSLLWLRCVTARHRLRGICAYGRWSWGLPKFAQIPT